MFNLADLTLADITAVLTVLVGLKPVVFIRIASVGRNSGIAFSATICAGEGINVGASLVSANFLATLLLTGWFNPSVTRLEVATLGAVLVSFSPVSRSVIASTNGGSFDTDVGMLVGALVLGTHFQGTRAATPFWWLVPATTLVGRVAVLQVATFLTRNICFRPVCRTTVASTNGSAFGAYVWVACIALTVAAHFCATRFASSRRRQTTEASAVAVVEWKNKHKHKDVVFHD